MIKFEITYAGKKYSDIAEVLTVAIIEGIKETYMEALEPFKNEINDHHGWVSIDIPKDLKNATINFHDLPDELVDRIFHALN